MSQDAPFREIPDYPSHLDGTGVVVRMLDGLGFRFYWATEGLSDEEYAFRPCPGAMSIAELQEHIWALVNWMNLAMGRKEQTRPEENARVRNTTLEGLLSLRDSFDSLSDEDVQKIRLEGKPFWHLLNGPIADALTHVGQINTLRRVAGNPAQELNPFLGVPPG